MTATPTSSPPSPSSQKPRVCTREACDTCRDKKAKCSGDRPCTRCAQRNIDCVYESRHYRTKRSLRDEIAALRQKNLEKDEAIEELRRQDANPNPNQDQAQLALLSPQSPVYSTHDRHHAVSTAPPSSQYQSPSFDAYHLPDANGAFAAPNSESAQSYSGSRQLATDLLQADSTVSSQAVPLLNATNMPSGGYDPGFSMPWSGLSQAQGVGSMAPSESTRSFYAGLDAISLGQGVNPMFTLHNPDAYRMANKTMGVPQAGVDQPWDVYHADKPAYAAVSPVSASENATLTAPTPPLSPSTSLAGLNDMAPPSPAAEHRPASRERHRLASARNWRKQKSAAADLQAEGQRARPEEQVGHGTGKRNHADTVEQAGSAKSQKQTICA
ncbi:Exocyst complex component EXO84 [Verticillium dahliae VDG1]|nr:Exocyst complex component EXO84 [Verticillium dahliae VDG1]